MANFPDEVIKKILSKLPFKSLARFSYVSKTWNAIISSPQFNIQRFESHPHNTFIVWGPELYTTLFFIMRLENRNFVIDPADSTELYNFVLPLCSCNGILLLRSPIGGDMHEISLFNPRAYLRVDESDSNSNYTTILTQSDSLRPINFGHYYDSRNDDYKVVLVYRQRAGEEEYSVYSCRNKIWSDKKSFPEHYFTRRIRHEKGLFVDGWFYWWLKDEVVGFDVRREKFYTSVGPMELSEVDWGYDYFDDTVKLAEVAGRLCLYIKATFCLIMISRAWVLEKNDDIDDHEEEDEDEDDDDEDWKHFGSWRELLQNESDDFDGFNTLWGMTNLGKKDSVVSFISKNLYLSRYFVKDDEDEHYEEIRIPYTFNLRRHYNVVQFSEGLFSPGHYYR